ncbi:MAG: type II secretion system F family protein [Streptomycetaceae bacterium]|nr:type II secretion system F family protein [Streptomycetaceae bacterium]
MGIPLLLGLFAGLAATGGLVGLVTGLVGTTRPPTPGPVGRFRRAWRSEDRDEAVRAKVRVRWAAALVVALAIWVLSGWFVLGLLAVLLIVGLPWLLAPTKATSARIDQLDALAEWTRRLADVLLLGMGLEQAMIASRKTAPKPLEEPVGELAARLQSGWRPEDALRAFADTLRDSTADKVAAALVLRAADRGPGLAAALTDLADTVRDEVRQRRQIEADRAKPRTTVRWMTFMTIGVVVAGSLDPEYVQPYGTVVGQTVLTMLIAAFAAVLAWMRSLASFRPTPRFLATDARSAVQTSTRTAATPTTVSTDGVAGPIPSGGAR